MTGSIMKSDEERAKLIIWLLSVLCLVLLAALLLLTSVLSYPREPGNRVLHHEPSSFTPKRLSRPRSGETTMTKIGLDKSDWIWYMISSPSPKSLVGPTGRKTVW